VDRSSSQPRRSRRLAALLAVAAAFCLLPASAGAAVQARSSDSFVDSIGVNTHLYYIDTPYHDEFGLVKQRLKELGIRHIRENLVPDREDQYEMLNELAGQGVKSTLILGEPDDGQAGLNELVSVLKNDLQGSVAAVEGPNEWDLNGPSDWMSSLATYQAQLFSTIKSSSLAGLPVVGPSMGNTNSDPTDISGSLEYGNIHSYPNAEPPEWNLTRLLGTATPMSGSKPVMATETGYHNAMASDNGHRPASEAAAAVYLPRLYLEYYRRGIVRTFSYELLDEFSDPSGVDLEDNFGLLRNDFSPKPSFTALSNLIAILSDQGNSFTPGKLDFTVGGDKDELRQVLLQKSDGSYYLALWRAESVWSNKTLSPLTAPSGKVELSFGQTITGAEEFAPNSSRQALRTLSTDGTSLNVNVGAQVVIVRLATDGTSLGSIKVWVDEPAVEAGDPVYVEGKVAGTEGKPRKVKIQRWNKKSWKTVAKAKTKANGRFKKQLRLLGGIGASRIRVIADRAKPSNQVKVRVLAADGGPKIALGNARKSA